MAVHSTRPFHSELGTDRASPCLSIPLDESCRLNRRSGSSRRGSGSLADLATVVEDDPRAVAGDDAVVEAEEDPEVAVGPRGLVDGDAEGAVGGDPGDVAPVPVFVPGLPRSSMTMTLCAGMSATSLPARVIRFEARLYVGL